MGADQSTQTPNQLAFLSCLLKKDYNSDHAFWVSLMSHAGDRSNLTTPDSIFLNNVAAKFPLNFANLILSSVHEVVTFQQMQPGTNPTAEQLNQLELALQIFISCISVAISNPKNSVLLERLDTDLYNRLKELTKKQPNSKKAKKNDDAKKSEKPNVTENQNDAKNDQNQTEEAPKSAPNPAQQMKEAIKQVKPKVTTENKTASIKSPQEKKEDSDDSIQSEEHEEIEFDVKPREFVPPELLPKIEKAAKPKKPADASNQPAADSEKPKKKPANPKRAASPQPHKDQQKTTSAANRAKSPQPKRPKRTPEERAALAEHRKMRQYNGHVLTAFTNAVIELLFKDGLTTFAKKANQNESPKEKEESKKAETAPKAQEKPKAKKTANAEKGPVAKEEKASESQAAKVEKTAEKPTKKPAENQTPKGEKKTAAKTSKKTVENQTPKELKTAEKPTKKPAESQTPKEEKTAEKPTKKPAESQTPKEAKTAEKPTKKPAESQTPKEEKTAESQTPKEAKTAESQTLKEANETESKKDENEENKNAKKEARPNIWIQSGEISFLRETNITRKELIDSILVVSSLHIFYPKFKRSLPELTSQLIDSLPFNSFLLSTCRVAFRYMNERPPVTSEVSQLLRSSIALLIRLFTNPKFRQAVSEVEPQVFLRAIYAPDAIDTSLAKGDKSAPIEKRVSLPLFDPLDPLSKVSLSFLYICALFQPKFVPTLAAKGYSNMFLYNLLWAAQYFFEKEGVNYIHSIILSTVLLIVADPDAAKSLNRPFKTTSKGSAFIECNFKPSLEKKLTFGDLLLEVLLNFCQRDSFLPSLICVFHMISSHVNKFSPSTAMKMLELFEQVNEKYQSFVPLFLEVFATIVQLKDNQKNGFCPIIFLKQSIFKQIKVDSPSVQKSLPIIQKYIKKARNLVKKENKAKLDINETTEVLAKIDIEKLFPQPQKFTKHPHIFGGEIEKTWDQWADLIFQITCEKDVKNIKNLRNHLLSSQTQK